MSGFPSRSSPHTSDLHEGFAAATRELLRKRFLWFSGVAGSLGLVGLLTSFLGPLYIRFVETAAQMAEGQPAAPIFDPTKVPGFIGGAVVCAAYWTCFVVARRGRLSDASLLNLTFGLVVLAGAVHLIMRSFEVPGNLGLRGAVATHLLASLFLPWSVPQALRPIAAILILDWLTLVLFGKEPWGEKLAHILISPSVGIPGTLICWLRHSRRFADYQLSFFQSRYSEMRDELKQAQKIQAGLFPPPSSDGPVTFEYQYIPMRSIGGDYFYTAFGREEDTGQDRVSFVVMDVTGHGILAALTVNRLHGELIRLFAEEPAIPPGRLLKLLNRYVHLTLSEHNLYASALCIRITPGRSRLEYASAGHPTAFVRSLDGKVHDLPSTDVWLGACPDAEYHPVQQVMPFGPGDVLLAYTDGVTESQNRNGRHLGIDGVRKIIAAGRGQSATWGEAIIREVERHRYGPARDDILILEVARKLATGVVARGEAGGRTKTWIGLPLGATPLPRPSRFLPSSGLVGPNSASASSASAGSNSASAPATATPGATARNASDSAPFARPSSP
ncbi:MAG: PP2C family protein-serine/threonine phosphatase [Planctomycetota bacterium]|nr:PP2C family protein-serine/threonine phosphatase [Planctomycetota bacterium]